MPGTQQTVNKDVENRQTNESMWLTGCINWHYGV